MKSLLRIHFISLAAMVVLVNSTCAEEKIEISREVYRKVFDAFISYPDIKFISGKCGCGRSETQPPTANRPYFSFSYVPEHCINFKGPCEGMIPFTFYMDADTGKIWCDESVKTRILAMKESERQLTESIKNEEGLKAELKNVYAEIDQNRMFNKEKYTSLIQSNIPLFMRALNAVTPDIRSEAARILGQLSNYQVNFGQYKAKEAIPRLLELLKDEAYGVRYNAVWALGNIGERGDKVLVESIVPLMDDSDSLVRRGAVAALAKLGDSSLVTRFIALLEDTAVNQEIVRALAYIGDERAVVPLINLLNSKKYYYFLERDAIDTLGAIRSKQSIPALINLFNQEYTRNEKLHKDFLPRVPYMGAEAARALIKIGKDAVPYLIELLKSQDHLQRLYSVYALGLFKDTGCLESLNEALRVEENQTVKTYIEWAIAEIKGEEFVSSLSEQLKIEVKPSRKKYKLNSEINVFLNIKNAGPAPIVINTIPVQFVEVSFAVFAPGNQPVLYIGPMYHWDPLPTKDSLITLGAGQDYRTKTFNLQEYYKFDKPGTYKIIGVYSNSFYACGIEFGVYALTGTVKSEPVEIEID